MERGFPSKEAVRLSGVPYRTLDLWANIGFVVPSVVQASGRGSDRVYSFRDIVALRVAGKLRVAGISLQKLRKVMAYLREREGLESPFAETYLVSDGNDIFERRGAEIVSLLQRPGQAAFTWVLDLRGVIEEVRAKIAV